MHRNHAVRIRAAHREPPGPRSRAASDFAFVSFFVTAFLAAGYLVLWEPLLGRWLF